MHLGRAGPSPPGPAIGPARSGQTWQRLRGVRPFDALSAAVGLGFAGLASYLLLRMVTRLFWDGSLTLAPLQDVSRLAGLGESCCPTPSSSVRAVWSRCW